MQMRLTSKKPETFSIGSRGILIVYIHSGSRIFFFDLNSSIQYQFVEMYRVEKVVQPFRFSLGKLQQARSEEHTSELQSRGHLVCRLLLEKKKKQMTHA